jgi:predicted nucleic acid-binding Zn ribbon protein
MVDAARKIVDRDVPPDFCENCGSKDMKRPIAAPNFSFKDGGHKGEYSKYGPRKG